jgi:hypothetical protein
MLDSIKSETSPAPSGSSPPEFTQLVTAVMEVSLKAIGQDNPISYVEDQAVRDVQELQRLRRLLSAKGKVDLESADALRSEVLQVRITRDAALHLLECFRRLQRARRLFGRRAQQTTPQVGCANGHSAS